MSGHTYSVVELTRRITNTLTDAFADDVWVTGEISGLTRARGGHVYFDLIEPTAAPGEPTAAQLSVALFRMNKEVINRTLKRAGVSRMDNGIHVRIRAAVSFNERGGRLQLRMTGIDPDYILGQVALERERVLRRLREAGLMDRNSLLDLPVLALRIGLVTSANSAAYHDFIHELGTSNLAFRVTLVDTRVQGVGAGDHVRNALLTLSRLDLDVVALVRGGGARADLVTFDSEALARTIATMSVPVLTGVGHEVDRSIADDVAHTAYKTPTACAAALVARARGAQDRLEGTWREIITRAGAAVVQHDAAMAARAHGCVQSARSSVRGATIDLANRERRVVRETQHSLDSASRLVERQHQSMAACAATTTRLATSRISHSVEAIRARAPRHLAAAERQLTSIDARARSLDPSRLLARGWSITRLADGRLVQSAEHLVDGDVLSTRVRDGVIQSTVTTTPPGSND